MREVFDQTWPGACWLRSHSSKLCANSACFGRTRPGQPCRLRLGRIRLPLGRHRPDGGPTFTKVGGAPRIRSARNAQGTQNKFRDARGGRGVPGHDRRKSQSARGARSTTPQTRLARPAVHSGIRPLPAGSTSASDAATRRRPPWPPQRAAPFHVRTRLRAVAPRVCTGCVRHATVKGGVCASLRGVRALRPPHQSARGATTSDPATRPPCPPATRCGA